MRLGFIGLGKMGSRMVMKLLSDGHEVVVWNRSKDKIETLQAEAKPDWKLTAADSVEDLVKKAASDEPGSRIVWSMLPAGEATEQILEEIKKYAIIKSNLIS